MFSGTTTASTSAAAAAPSAQNHNSSVHVKPETNPFSLHTTEMVDPSPSSSSGPILIDGFEQDAALSKSDVLTRPELLNRRARRVKQLARIYRDHYWALMEELKLKHREYYWEYGKSPFVEDEENEKLNSSRADFAAENGNGNSGFNGGNSTSNAATRCGVNGCKAKAMALSKFCHMHILSDARQKLYKACTFTIKSSTTGPILCGKPILKSTVPSYCPTHFQKAEKYMVRSLKKSGLNISSTSKLAPKFHVIVAEYVRQIQHKRIAAKQGNTGIKEENNS
ncbi:hypothetical protein ACS0TY_009267 [Phlomoides rotata]